MKRSARTGQPRPTSRRLASTTFPRQRQLHFPIGRDPCRSHSDEPGQVTGSAKCTTPGRLFTRPVVGPARVSEVPPEKRSSEGPQPPKSGDIVELSATGLPQKVDPLAEERRQDVRGRPLGGRPGAIRVTGERPGDGARPSRSTADEGVAGVPDAVLQLQRAGEPRKARADEDESMAHDDRLPVLSRWFHGLAAPVPPLSSACHRRRRYEVRRRAPSVSPLHVCESPFTVNRAEIVNASSR